MNNGFKDAIRYIRDTFSFWKYELHMMFTDPISHNIHGLMQMEAEGKTLTDGQVQMLANLHNARDGKSPF